MKSSTPYDHIKLPLAFYLQKDVLSIARSMLGKVLVTVKEGAITAGRIVETEAYLGTTDRASHAWNDRKTHRTKTMYESGGIAYVYLCYGIHHLLNVVTNDAEIPQVVLIRALEPLLGVETMRLRTGKSIPDYSLTKGPGNLSKAMGILTTDDGTSLTGDEIFIADDGHFLSAQHILCTPRIGVDYAGEDALLPYRFIVKNNPYVSGKKQFR